MSRVYVGTCDGCGGEARSKDHRRVRFCPRCRGRERVRSLRRIDRRRFAQLWLDPNWTVPQIAAELRCAEATCYALACKIGLPTRSGVSRTPKPEVKPKRAAALTPFERAEWEILGGRSFFRATETERAAVVRRARELAGVESTRKHHRRQAA